MFKKLILVVCLLLLTACSTSNQDSAALEDSGQGKELNRVSLMLDWYPNAVHSFLYAGLEKGYYEEQGVDLEIKMPADTNDPLKLVASGQVDLALSYQPQVVMARAQQIPVVSYAAVVRHPLNMLMVPEDSDISSPKDLSGKTVGYPAIPMNEAMIQTMVGKDGGDPQQVTLVDVGWDLMPAISTNKVDAISGGFINHEKVLLEKQGFPVKVFHPVDYGVPDYYELVLVTSEEFAKENPELLNAFWEASKKGFEFVKESPSEGLDILFKRQEQSFPLERDVEEKSLEILLPLMSSGKESFGSQTEQSWEDTIQWMLETKLIEQKIEAKDSYVTP
ncbi:ABC transporter substrate-binding protein [Ammoniphilus resinae]|uniref:Hydroxymethylpyrimidine transport system substrate-binding protein n=1 Tax=Ammoniphilus resinae TaxID=861532 RepID=A0ABS4GRJ3_9BACL|nr:ABC transporter substrate-binding protein [Ammoniphilus resinae]MBP1932742.1 putative hydroxymethylpyrimidine transport system substrate-binding protein [Ammoniphilus resinae]